MNIVGKKYLFFLISLLIIIPGILSLLFYGLNPSIDFIGGSQMKFALSKSADKQIIGKINNIFQIQKQKIISLQILDQEVVIKTRPISQSLHKTLVVSLTKSVPGIKEEEFQTVGPVIGSETTINAIYSVIIASILIIIYIAISFWKVPKPAKSLRFGVCAVIALMHDVLVVLGIFSILGHFFHVEIDSLFVTAVLTIIGFSVHDTIVVFDRIRENLIRTSGISFSKVVNDSILQTLTRSLNTSLTVVLVLIALLLFGGESIKWFTVTLLIGVISGTYSSIFNASLLLVSWQEWDVRTEKRT